MQYRQSCHKVFPLSNAFLDETQIAAKKESIEKEKQQQQKQKEEEDKDKEDSKKSDK
jgi:hypothetical protein